MPPVSLAIIIETVGVVIVFALVQFLIHKSGAAPRSCNRSCSHRRLESGTVDFEIRAPGALLAMGEDTDFVAKESDSTVIQLLKAVEGECCYTNDRYSTHYGSIGYSAGYL